DQNGTSDLYLQSAWTGEVVVWSMNGSELLGSEALPLSGVLGKLVGVADLDGDGDADLLWADGSVLRATLQGETREVGRLPAGWIVAEAMQFDKGGSAEVLLQDTATGAVKVWTLDNQGQKSGERPLDYGTHDGTLVVQRARRAPAARPEDPQVAFVR